MKAHKVIWIILFSGLLLIGCTPEPRPINFGSDECAYCKMMITDSEFASQIVNQQGKAYKFDSIECMAAYAVTNHDDNVHSVWVPDFNNSDEWILADKAVYLHSETLRSPMGLFLSAYTDRPSAEKMQAEYGGTIIDFSEVKELVNETWLSEENRTNMMNH